MSFFFPVVESDPRKVSFTAVASSKEYPQGKRSVAKRMKRKILYLKLTTDFISHGVFIVVVVVVVVLFLAFL